MQIFKIILFKAAQGLCQLLREAEADWNADIGIAEGVAEPGSQ